MYYALLPEANPLPIDASQSFAFPLPCHANPLLFQSLPCVSDALLYKSISPPVCPWLRGADPVSPLHPVPLLFSAFANLHHTDPCPCRPYPWLFLAFRFLIQSFFSPSIPYPLHCISHHIRCPAKHLRPSPFRGSPDLSCSPAIPV